MTTNIVLRFRFAIATMFTAFALLAVPHPALATATTLQRSEAGPTTGMLERLPLVTYTAFDGHTEALVPWQGRFVSVLAEPGTIRDTGVMRKLVKALDRAWHYYETTTGRRPAPNHSLNGRVEIAEVSHTCGVGCGNIGSTGIEIEAATFERMYQQLADSNLYDQIPFYEMGRNFWFWSPQLPFRQPDESVTVVAGFAVWMRFRSIEAAHVQGGPVNGTPFPTFASEVADLAGQYEANPSMTFAETLAVNKSPGLYAGTDFWASLMMQLAERHGGQTFVERFWHHASELPGVFSTPEAVTNWVRDASYAACADLSSVFYVRWGFPRPDGSVTGRPAASAVPEPAGRC